MEAWLAAVTLVPHHARFAAALAIAVTLSAEGACGDSRDRHLSTHTWLHQLFKLHKMAKKEGRRKWEAQPQADE